MPQTAALNRTVTTAGRNFSTLTRVSTLTPISRQSTPICRQSTTGPLFRSKSRPCTYKDVDEDGAVRRELAQKEDEMLEMQEQLDSQSQRLARLESEMKLVLAAKRAAEEAHKHELALAEAQGVAAVAQRRELVEKLQAIGVVEGALRELYVVTKSRVAQAELGSSGAAEAEQLQGVPPLVIISNLRAQLTSLLTFKVEAEAQMRGAQEEREGVRQARVQALMSDSARLQSALLAANMEASEQQAKAAAELRLREEELQQHDRLLEDMQEQQQGLLAALKEEQALVARLRAALKAAQDEGSKRDSLLLVNKQLESARHFDRASQDKELRAMHAEHRREVAAMQREGARLADALRENQQLREELQGVHCSLASFKRSKGVKREAELEAAVQRLSAALRQSHQQRRLLVQQLGMLRSKYGEGDPRAELLKSVELGKLELPSEAVQQLEEDPVYRVLANVGVLHQKAKSEVKRIRGELDGQRFREAALVSDAFFLDTKHASSEGGIKCELRRCASGASPAVSRSRRAEYVAGVKGG